MSAVDAIIDSYDKALTELRSENERLHARINSLGDELDELGFKCADVENENKQLQARLAELEAGYSEAINDCAASFYCPLNNVDAHRAVIDGVVKSVEDYDAYLARQLTDGAKP
jgi:predicted nuclease with TOPRIM domain